MEHILLIIHVFIALSLIVSILIQRTSSDGMSGMGGGQSNPSGLLSGRASANLLTRTTAILAALFIINSLVLSVMASRGSREQGSIVDSLEGKQQQIAPVEKKPAAPAKGEKAKDSKPAAPIAE
ncbi:MAG: preprotein translocase subunit SecG [Proteobacteria bacterium]|nr:preprotein translocase subunit SecG [Pseudomonadota bacterium]